jgi:hypothetical protein
MSRRSHINSGRLQRAYHGERRFTDAYFPVGDHGVDNNTTNNGHLQSYHYSSGNSNNINTPCAPLGHITFFYAARRGRRRRHTTILLALLFLVVSQMHALPPRKSLRPQYERRIYSFSIAGGSGYSFDKVDTRNSDPASSLLLLTGMFRFHFFVTPNAHIQIGFENLSQKCKFNTYYFADGHSTFYDKSFGYTHRLRTYELYIPIIARIGLTPQEDNAPAVFYLMGGYAIKTYLASTAVITRNSDNKDVWGGTTELTFEHYFLSEQTSSVALVGIGADKRLGMTQKFFSFELFYRYNFSRIRYQGNYNTNDLMIKNSCITFQIGYRFQ